jgi:hypothetical protein
LFIIACSPVREKMKYLGAFLRFRKKAGIKRRIKVAWVRMKNTIFLMIIRYSWGQVSTVYSINLVKVSQDLRYFLNRRIKFVSK